MKKILFMLLISLPFFMNAQQFPQRNKAKVIKPRVNKPRTTNNNNENDKFDPCCPPINASSMVDQFVHVPTGSINDPYKIKFQPTNQFRQMMQAYINLLNLTCGAKELHFSWNLDKISGFGGNTIVNVEKEYFHFKVNGSGTIQNNPSFFDQPCNVGDYYRIRVGVYPNDKLDCFDAVACSASLSFEYTVQLNKSRQPTLMINGMPNKKMKRR